MLSKAPTRRRGHPVSYIGRVLSWSPANACSLGMHLRVLGFRVPETLKGPAMQGSLLRRQMPAMRAAG